MKEIFYKGRFIFFPLIAAAIAGLVGMVVMLLWNNLMPEIFGLPLITFWQALGLFILCKVLFGFGKGGGGWKKHRRNPLRDMTPEEREQFRDRMKNWRC